MLGDIIMSTPFLRQLRKNYGDSEIDYLVGEKSAKALEKNPNINNIIKFDENIFFKKKIIQWVKLTLDMRKNNYDKIYILDKHWLINIIAYFFRSRELIGFYRKNNFFNLLDKKVFFGPIRHEILYNLDLLDIDDGRVDFKDLKTEIFMDRDSSRKNINREYIAVINSGGKNISDQSSTRMMPNDLFIELVEKLAYNREVILLGSKDDFDYYDKLNFYNQNIKNYAGMNFEDSVKLMKYAKKIVTTDCGAMHMAGAVNDNLICVFGPTNPKRKLPIGKNIKYVWLDEDLYTSDYEVFRKIPPKNIFMKKIKTSHILKCLS